MFNAIWGWVYFSAARAGGADLSPQLGKEATCPPQPPKFTFSVKQPPKGILGAALTLGLGRESLGVRGRGRGRRFPGSRRKLGEMVPRGAPRAVGRQRGSERLLPVSPGPEGAALPDTDAGPPARGGSLSTCLCALIRRRGGRQARGDAVHPACLWSLCWEGRRAFGPQKAPAETPAPALRSCATWDRWLCPSECPRQSGNRTRTISVTRARNSSPPSALLLGGHPCFQARVGTRVH